jgi:hypothetical protein
MEISSSAVKAGCTPMSAVGFQEGSYFGGCLVDSWKEGDVLTPAS